MPLINSQDVLQQIPVEDRIAALTLDLDEYGEARALGLSWHTERDELSCKTTDKIIEPIVKVTKRTIISKIASICDVFGVVAPFVIRAKVLVQDLWKMGVDWDEEVSEEVKKQFKRWEKELPALKEISIQRKLLEHEKTLKQVQLHGFADASLNAY